MPNIIYIPFVKSNTVLFKQRETLRNTFMLDDWKYEGEMILTDPFETKVTVWVLTKGEK